MNKNNTSVNTFTFSYSDIILHIAVCAEEMSARHLCGHFGLYFLQYGNSLNETVIIILVYVWSIL